MKILIIGQYPKNINIIRGGVESSVYGLASELEKRENLEIIIINPPNKDEKGDVVNKAGRLKILNLENKYRYELFAFLYCKKILNIISSIKPDICHLHGNSILNMFLILLLKIKEIPHVLTVHGILTIEHWNNLKRNVSLKYILKFLIYSIVEALTILFSKYIIVDTKYVNEKIKKKSVVIPQGIDIRFYQINDKSESNLLLSIGAICPRKGYEYSIEAIYRIKKKISDVKYVIIGSLGKDNYSYYQNILRLIQDKNLEENVQILTNTDSEKIEDFLSRANIFLLHSEEESQGISIVEAMAAGKPIISTNRGGIPYVVNHMGNGCLSSFGDIDEFEKNISMLIKDKKLRTEFSNNSKVLAQAYKWENIADKLVHLYCNILKAKSL